MSPSIRGFPYKLDGDNRIAIYPDNTPSAPGLYGVQNFPRQYITYIGYGGESCPDRWEINVNSHYSLKLGQERRKVDCELEEGQRERSRKPDVGNSLPSANHSLFFLLDFFKILSIHLRLVRFFFLQRNSCNDGVHSSSICNRNLLVNYYTAEKLPSFSPRLFVWVGLVDCGASNSIPNRRLQLPHPM